MAWEHDSISSWSEKVRCYLNLKLLFCNICADLKGIFSFGKFLVFLSKSYLVFRPTLGLKVKIEKENSRMHGPKI